MTKNPSSTDQILNYISKNKKARVNDLWTELGFSRQLIQKQLKIMVNQGTLVKVGRPPLVFYQLASENQLDSTSSVPAEIVSYIDKEYLYVSPLGEVIYGFDGFKEWIKSIDAVPQEKSLAIEYVNFIKDIKKHYNALGFINATDKIKQTFPKIYLDKVYYMDFYAIPKFGKTKLGKLVLYSKQSQKYELIKSVSIQSKPMIQKLIEKEKVDAVSFIPPTVPRNIQFIKEFEKILEIHLPKIELSKAYIGEIPVAQKTLSKLTDRIQNADQTIFVRGTKKYNKVLIIDDAVGSGASLNETAKKLLNEGIAKKVIGLAIVGSYKGFEVINEV